MTKIVLLEPDIILGKTYAQALKKEGHVVIWCQDAQSAIHKTDKQTPEIIITELQLAGHNGVEFLYELRSYDDWEKIPAIVLSHVPLNTKDISVDSWKHLNVVAYLYKPFTRLRDIIKTVEQILVSV